MDEQAVNLDASKQVTSQETIHLLFHEGWLEEAAAAEDEVGGNISAGLDWGSVAPALLVNPSLFWRLKTLRVSLNREIRLIIDSWNLGVGATAAKQAARTLVKEKLMSPAPEVIPHLELALQQDDLYNEEFISNREVLKALLKTLLTNSDWETIASVAAESVSTHVKTYSMCS